MDIATLLVRIAIGIPLLVHGTTVLLSWHGGGVDSYGAFLDTSGRIRGWTRGLSRGSIEWISGAFILLGFALPIAAGGVAALLLHDLFRNARRDLRWGETSPAGSAMRSLGALMLAVVGAGAHALDPLVGTGTTGPAALGISLILAGVIDACLLLIETKGSETEWLAWPLELSEEDVAA